MKCTTASGSRITPWWPPPPSPTAISATASSRTRRSIWWTRPRAGCGSRSTPCRRRSTRSSARSCSTRSSWRRSPRRRTRPRRSGGGGGGRGGAARGGAPPSTRLEAELERRVVGQPEALAAVANAVRRARAGLQDPNRPTGSFIFLGPTGVGKTETARALAEFLFDDEKAMVRLDMSEYMEKHAVARMIGAPPGYVGYEEGGQLTEAVRRRPYAVVLFDEIEKAHPDVFNVLLQILDDGRLTDSQGRTVDFRNTVLIMTSNIGSQYILEMGTQNWEQVETKVLELLRQTFKPEFLNRVDDVIIFRPLSSEDIARIVDLQIERVERLVAGRKLRLEVTHGAKQLIVAEGYDPVYGARPLKRSIQRLLQNPLALAVLEGKFAEGDRIRVDRAKDGNSLTFQRVPAAAPEAARA